MPGRSSATAWRPWSSRRASGPTASLAAASFSGSGITPDRRDCRQSVVSGPTVGSNAPPVASRLGVEPAGVLVTAFKPARDGKALIVRLFNASDRPQQARVVWGDPAPKTVCLSDLAETPGKPLAGPIEMAPSEFVTLRASLP